MPAKQGIDHVDIVGGSMHASSFLLNIDLAIKNCAKVGVSQKRTHARNHQFHIKTPLPRHLLKGPCSVLIVAAFPSVWTRHASIMPTKEIANVSKESRFNIHRDVTHTFLTSHLHRRRSRGGEDE
jgi:hypothetical protein